MKGTCYVIREAVVPGSGGKMMDFSDAERFGEVKFVTQFDPSLNAAGTANISVINQMREVVNKFNPDTDWIIATGSPLALIMMGAVMGTQYNKLPVLVWNRLKQGYSPIVIDIA